MRLRLAWGAAEAPTLLAPAGPIVLIDALRMSATTIVAVHCGMTVLPVATPEEALRLKAKDPSCLTAGERGGAKIPELNLGNSPTRLLERGDLAGRTLALTTGNGVPALLGVRDHAHPVLIGSPLNLGALAAYIKAKNPAEVGLLLAGRNGAPAGEDAMTAALLLERLEIPVPETLPRPLPPPELEAFFFDTESASLLIPLGYAADVQFCATVDRYPTVPELHNARRIR